MPMIDAENTQLRLDDSDSVFVWNVMTGASFALTDVATVNVGYRYVATGQVTFGGTYAGPDNLFDYEFDAHEGFVGLRFSF